MVSRGMKKLNVYKIRLRRDFDKNNNMKISDFGAFTDKGNLAYLKYEVRDDHYDKVLSAKMEICTFNDYQDINPDNTINLFNIVRFIDSNATCVDYYFDKYCPVGSSLSEHYKFIITNLMRLQQDIFSNSYNCLPDSLLVSADIVPILTLTQEFKSYPIPDSKYIQSIYKCGNILKQDVYVSAALEPGTIISLVMKDNNLSCAIGIGFKDNKYSLKVLNKNLMLKMKVINGNN